MLLLCGFLLAACANLEQIVVRFTPAEAGVTPLHLAVLRNQEGMVTQLLAQGADPNAQTFDSHLDRDWDYYMDRGVVPLHVAADKGAVNIAQVLLAAGADPTSPTTKGRLPSTWRPRKMPRK